MWLHSEEISWADAPWNWEELITFEDDPNHTPQQPLISSLQYISKSYGQILLKVSMDSF